ncbi:MAG: orotidine-5'-phosphate decarboxylase [Planctomycetota bacterium]
MSFPDRLSALCAARGPICAGLDPRGREPAGVSREAFAASTAARLAGEVAALKPQLAFFDDSWEGPRRVAEAARQGGALCIADCKRGDIGSTSAAYAEAILGAGSPFDAATVNPYLGADALEPWIEVAAREGKGLFVLVKTSNPGSGDLQDLRLEGGELVCERVARLVTELGRAHRGAESGRSLVGAVVGLTAPRDLIARLRALMPAAFFLLPGYGAQGGDPAALAAARDARGAGVLVSASRSLTIPWEGAAPADWGERVDRALAAMRADLAGA